MDVIQTARTETCIMFFLLIILSSSIGSVLISHPLRIIDRENVGMWRFAVSYSELP